MRISGPACCIRFTPAVGDTRITRTRITLAAGDIRIIVVDTRITRAATRPPLTTGITLMHHTITTMDRVNKESFYLFVFSYVHPALLL